MATKSDIAVIGAGIAGCSAAAALSASHRVTVFETESQPGYHSTGRSAAIFVQNYGTGLIRAITALAEPFFTNAPKGFAQNPLLTPRGLLRLGRNDQIDRLKALFDEMSADTAHLYWIDGAEAKARVPLLKKGIIAGGMANDRAQDIDVHALQNGYIRQIQNNGGQIITNAEVSKLAHKGGRWQIETRQGLHEADIVINAAGAWADVVAQMAGLAPLGITPCKRSAITFDAPDGVQVGDMQMVVDADEEFYLKPEGGRLMASPAEEEPTPPSDCQPSEMDVAICADRIMQHFEVDIRRIHSRWAGLRSFAPDREPVCGFDRAVPSFFWLVGQGGAGVQTAPALAQITADLVGGKNPKDIQLSDRFTALDLSPARFERD